MKLLEGKKVAEKLEQEIAKETASLEGRKPGLAFIRVGKNSASMLYIKRKRERCSAVGITSFAIELEESTSQEALLKEIDTLNQDPLVDGILLQLPLPKRLSPLPFLQAIDPKKDVDGFHPMNMGKLLIGDNTGFIPCTPKGIHTLLQEYGVETSGKNVVIVGRSNIVGKPLAAPLCQKGPLGDATVTLAHGSTKNLPAVCKKADILITALGKPLFITKEFVKEGACVIDVGINKIETSDRCKIVGDVDFENVSPLCSYITPVPGGVGPMTIASLLANTLKARKTS